MRVLYVEERLVLRRIRRQLRNAPCDVRLLNALARMLAADEYDALHSPLPHQLVVLVKQTLPCRLDMLPIIVEAYLLQSRVVVPVPQTGPLPDLVVARDQEMLDVPSVRRPATWEHPIPDGGEALKLRHPPRVGHVA